MPPKGLKKGTQEMKDYMKSLRDMRKNKNNKLMGKGLISDTTQFVKNNVLKPVGSFIIDEATQLIPAPNIVKKGIRGAVREVTGLGMNKRGKGLMPAGY